MFLLVILNVKTLKRSITKILYMKCVNLSRFLLFEVLTYFFLKIMIL